MKYISHNYEIENSTKQFLDMFNTIRIRRKTRDNRVQKTISVPCVFASRSRILKSLENKDKTLKLPIIGVSITGISRDTARVHSVNDDLNFQVPPDYNPIHKIATPVNVTYELEIITKYVTDFDQIISNFMPMMNPDVYFVVPNPKNPSENLKIQVVWDGDVSITYPEDISETEPWRIIGSSSFTIKTWIFPGEAAWGDGDGDDTGAGRIRKINFCSNDGTSGIYNNFYVVPTLMEFDDFMDNVRAGYVDRSCHDELQFIDDLSGLYWTEDIYGVLSGELYDFTSSSADLSALIENEDNPDLAVSILRQDGSFFTPEPFLSADWPSIWRRFLSGDIQQCVSQTSADWSYRYLIDSTHAYFILYSNESLIPIVL